jgi:hypothetical protein
MAYGFATHLWIYGTPSGETLRRWVVESCPDARETDLVVFRLGDRTVISAANVDDRTARYRSIGVVGSLARGVPSGMATTFVDLQPDVESYVVDDEVDARDPDQVEAAKRRLQKLVRLELEELYHYVDWAHALEELEDGAPAPSLPGVAVQRLELGLPPRAARASSPVGAAVTPVGLAGAGPSGAVTAVAWLFFAPLLVLSIAGPLAAFPALLPSMIRDGDVGSGVFVTALMEAGFALPLVLVWTRVPRWGRATLIFVHVGAVLLGLGRGFVLG